MFFLNKNAYSPFNNTRPSKQLIDRPIHANSCPVWHIWMFQHITFSGVEKTKTNMVWLIKFSIPRKRVGWWVAFIICTRGGNLGWTYTNTSTFLGLNMTTKRPHSRRSSRYHCRCRFIHCGPRGGPPAPAKKIGLYNALWMKYIFQIVWKLVWTKIAKEKRKKLRWQEMLWIWKERWIGLCGKMQKNNVMANDIENFSDWEN